MLYSATLRVLGKVFLVLLACFGAYLAYRYFSGEAPPEQYNLYKEHVIKTAAGDMVPMVASRTGKPRKILLPRVTGDSTGRITYLIKQKLVHSAGVEVLEPQLTEDAQESVKEWFFSALRKIVKPEEAKALAERSRADAILFVDVDKFHDSPEETVLELSFKLQSRKGEKLHAGKLIGRLEKSVFSITYLQLWIWSASPWIRALVWVVFATLLPLVTYKIAYAVLAKQENLYNALLVAVYTALDSFLAWVLLGFTLDGFVPFILFVLALLGGGVWSFLILDEFEDMRR